MYRMLLLESEVILFLLSMTAKFCQTNAKNCSLSIYTFLPIHTDLYFDARISEPCVQIAAKEIANSSLQNCDINWLVANDSDPRRTSCGEMQANAVHIVSEVYYNLLSNSLPTLAAVVGTSCSDATALLGDIATSLNFVVLEGAGVSTKLDDKVRYPTLIREGFTQARARAMVALFMRRYNWTTIVVANNKKPIYWVSATIAIGMNVSGMDPLSPDISYRRALRVISSAEFSELEYDYNNESTKLAKLERIVTLAYSQSRVLFMHSSADDIRTMLLIAHAKNYTSDSIYIGLAYFKTANYYGIPDWYKKDDSQENNERARQAFRSLFLTKLAVPRSAQFKEFESRADQLAFEKYHQHILPYDEINTHAIAFHDVVLAYAQALNETLARHGDILDGAAVVRRMKNRTFTGERGLYFLDSNGDLQGHFEIWSFQWATSSFTKALDFPEEAKDLVPVNGTTIEWVMGRPPPSVPKCGFAGICPLPNDDTMTEAASGTAGLVVIMILVACLIQYAHNRAIRAIQAGQWMIGPEELSPVDRNIHSRATLAKVKVIS